MISKLRRVRKMTYVLWAWCLLILTWAIAGGASAENSNSGFALSASSPKPRCNKLAGAFSLLRQTVNFD